MHTDPKDKLILPSRVQAIVLVARVDAPTLRALRFAVSQRPTSVEAVHVDIQGDGARDLAVEWDRRGIDVPLRLVASPYRELTRPVVEYVTGVRRSSPRDLVLVYVPSYRPDRWWELLLHNQTALAAAQPAGRHPGRDGGQRPADRGRRSRGGTLGLLAGDAERGLQSVCGSRSPRTEPAVPPAPQPRRITSSWASRVRSPRTTRRAPRAHGGEPVGHEPGHTRLLAGIA